VARYRNLIMPVFLNRLVFLLLCLSSISCATITPDQIASEPDLTTPVRFLLTFDDGPGVYTDMDGKYPTLHILDQLKNNPYQPGIKAVFFVQTRNSNGGGSELGKQYIKREYREGHLVCLHIASKKGHISYTSMSADELDQSLENGKQDIFHLTGEIPSCVRPTFWKFNSRVVSAFNKHQLKMVLTDINARDGVIYVFNVSFRRRSHFNHWLYQIRKKMLQKELPVVDGVVPIIVTFHDPNVFTAHHMTEYLEILMTESRNVRLPVSSQPFYNDRVKIKEALSRRPFNQGPYEF